MRSAGVSRICLYLGLFAGCVDGAPPSPTPTISRVAPARRAPALADRAAVPIAASVAVRPAVLPQAELVEDGGGRRIAPIRPVAIDVTGRWPARALDPVLEVGDRRFRDYRYVGIDVLRFVAADASLVPDDAEIAIGYGDEHPGGSRIVVRAAAVRP
jgi:hypothetical protein